MAGLLAGPAAAAGGDLEPGRRLAAARQALELGEPALAEHHARLALAELETRLGEAALVERDLERAEAAFARAASAAPAFALDARTLLAATRLARGEPEAALGELRLVVSAAPEHALARRHLVRALAASGTVDEARRELAALAELDAEAAAGLAPRLERAVARPDEARALFGEAPTPRGDGPSLDEPTLLERTAAEIDALLGETALDSDALAERLIDRLAERHADAVRRALADGRIDGAIEALRDAAGGDPPGRDVAFILAILERRAGRPAASSAGLADLAERHGSPAAYLALAENARAAGARKLAFDSARRASELAPAAEGPMRVYAALGLDAGLAPAVAPAVETLARMRPQSADYARLVGRVWMDLGDTGEAAEAFGRALELAPGDPRTDHLLGLALVREGRFEAARDHLRRAVDAHAAGPDALDTLAALAEAEERLGEVATAEARARRVLERAPHHAGAHYVLGLVEAGRGDFAAARGALEAAVAADPGLAKAHYRLSFACARLGDRPCADEHLALYRRAQRGPEADMRLMTPAPRAGTRR